MPPPTRGTRRDVAALEARRLEAGRLSGKGTAQAEVVRILGVTRTAVSRWYQVWRTQGRAGLKGAGRAGRKPRLDARQWARVEAALRRGSGAHGFATELWTLPRVATVLARLTGVTYDPGHVWYRLRRLGWSLQRPTRLARLRRRGPELVWRGPHRRSCGTRA